MHLKNRRRSRQERVNDPVVSTILFQKQGRREHVMSYANNVVSLPQSVDYHALLSQKILEHSAKVTVIGQGYVGLPLAVEFGRMGFTVTGLDVSSARVQELNAGHSPTPDIADADLQMLRLQGRYNASTDFACLATSDVILICVPTPLRKSKDPDISYVLDS